jgi:hypothetical protein
MRKGNIMLSSVKNFLVKPIMAFAIAVPLMAAGNVNTAEAGHKNHKRAAIIAGAIIGGAIIYNHHKRKKYKRHYRKSYGHGHYRAGHRHGYKHYRSGHRYGYRHYRSGHRYGHRGRVYHRRYYK